MADVTPISLGILDQLYQDVSRRGRYAGGEQDRLAQACSDSLQGLPPHRRIVAFALCEFFTVGSKNFDRITESTITWAQLDASILEAVRFVAKDGNPLDAIRITDAVNMNRLDWFGD